MAAVMPQRAIAKFLRPWTFGRDKKQLRVNELRRRDGDNCRRCRRPMRFDLPRGNDMAPTILQILPEPRGSRAALENLCLCHGHCNRHPGDNTPEVRERRRLRQVGDAASLPWA
jgi:hypothetical protein